MWHFNLFYKCDISTVFRYFYLICFATYALEVCHFVHKRSSAPNSHKFVPFLRELCQSCNIKKSSSFKTCHKTTIFASKVPIKVWPGGYNLPSHILTYKTYCWSKNLEPTNQGWARGFPDYFLTVHGRPQVKFLVTIVLIGWLDLN